MLAVVVLVGVLFPVVLPRRRKPWDRAAVLRFGAIRLASTLLGALPPVRRAARATPASLIATP